MKNLMYFSWPLWIVSSCAAQGTFGNLNFEQGQLVPVPNLEHYVYAANALPGWKAYMYGEEPYIFYNEVSIGAASIGVHDRDYVGWLVPVPLLQGRFSLFFQPEVPDRDPTPYITQTGVLPSWGASIRFLTASETQPGFSAYLDCKPLDVVPLHRRLNNGYVWGANFNYAEFGNEEVELRIGGSGVLDNIFFSPSAIPEPGWLGLLWPLAASLWLRKTRTGPRLAVGHGGTHSHVVWSSSWSSGA